MRHFRSAQTMPAIREFHVSRASRDKYAFDQALYTLRGNVIFADFHSARVFAQKVNAERDLLHHPEQAVRAADLNAIGLLEEILHTVVAQYRRTIAPDLWEQALESLTERLASETVETILRAYADQFPALSVYLGNMDTDIYLAGETESEANREIVLEELLMLWLANANPAASPFRELFDDQDLDTSTAYGDLVLQLHHFFDTMPPYGPRDENLMDMLHAPAVASPDSLQAQLDFVRIHWGSLIGTYLERLLRGLDFIAEENKVFFGFGPGPAQILTYDDMGDAPENFSADLEWMPNVVMLAKNVYVWLDQLSKQYEQPIQHLDQVPDEELEKLRHRGITALWLIGLWERSVASKRIKQMMGNPDAVASAYSLKRYAIADDLGGEEAFDNLRYRAWQRGIRMASDMVPNHTGIDSDWMIEHPDWFINLDYSPFPTYTFNGTDLCDDERVGIYLEDHYYTHSDAAVVMKRVDHWTGDQKYVYHGNDGTMMPWNDTAQLNYLLPEVREAVIQTILDVARRSPIIRFDAAMTLTKLHYQRLWYPEPGSGGDIASRADHGLPKADFDAAFPIEFWREVVDRVAEEVPDTLLLAEAFWMMEGYFVRSLGMHRVYNSAFMNMLRDEKNAEYHKLIKNTLEYDPQILKRYVNFMNNPDEKTAIEQFGDGDKYFGICTLMITLPGLPMLGHGQVEGYAEKYGMEYRRAYWDETPNTNLVGRHEQQIFPLAHKRYLFAGVENFALYDFYTAGGQVDENIFAYSNRVGQERALVLYHNRFAETKGWLKASASYLVKDVEKPYLNRHLLGEGLDIPNDVNAFVIFRDVVTGLQYIRNCQDLHETGLYVELHAYQTQVFLDFYVMQDNASHHYSRVCVRLNGQGVPNIEHAIKEMYLEPVYRPFRMLVSAPAFEWLRENTVNGVEDEPDARLLEQAEEKIEDLLVAVAAYEDIKAPVAEEIDSVVATLSAVLTFKAWLDNSDALPRHCRPAAEYLSLGMDDQGWETLAPLLTWVFVRGMSHVSLGDAETDSRDWYDEWLLNKIFGQSLRELGLPQHKIERISSLVGLLLDYSTWAVEDLDDLPTATLLVERMLSIPQTLGYLGVNRFQDVLWFNQEALETLLWWVQCIATLRLYIAHPNDWDRTIANLYYRIQRLFIAVSVSEYQVDKLLANLE